jgi:hypothetical protein
VLKQEGAWGNNSLVELVKKSIELLEKRGSLSDY